MRNHLSIGSLLVGWGLLSVVTALALAITGFVGAADLSDALKRVVIVDQALRNHNDADSFMDDVRADVLRAIQAATGTNQEGKEFIRGELRHHHDVIKTSIVGNLALPLPPRIHGGYVAISNLVVPFFAASESAVELALSDPALGASNFEHFRSNFVALEDAMDSTREQLRGIVRQAGISSERTAERVRDSLIAATAIGLFLFGCVSVAAIRTAQRMTDDINNSRAALRESEASLDRAQSIAGIGSWELDLASGRLVWSKELYRIRGLSPEHFEPNVDNLSTYLDRDDYPVLRKWLSDLSAGIEVGELESHAIRPDGGRRLLRVEGQALRSPDGAIRRLAGTMQDVTERRLIEQQLAQSQKMEAIGNLTGGMAHDFNNVLGIIIGNLDLLARVIQANPVAAELCEEARDGASRCADLIRRLLAFARRQPLRPKRIDVNGLVGSIGKLLGRILGEDIELTMRLDSKVWSTIADPAQLETALTNLATNARDAMKRGGRLVIATSNAHLDADYAGLTPGVTPGDYVLIEASDTGVGIDAALIDQIFEPFFTTKETGKGTGLGLSMVFGFVKQSGGHIAVDSEPGRGSTFRLYLPRDETPDIASDPIAGARRTVGGNESVLVVEDNARLRNVAVQQLRALGYRTREAENAEAALVVLAEADNVDLLFTDVIMPGKMDGILLAREATCRVPSLRVLLTSGFPDLRGSENRLMNLEYRLLSKPFGQDELAHAVRQVLDHSSARACLAAAEAV